MKFGVNSTISNTQAMSLTGQYVILNVPDAAGNINPVSGIVDYVTMSEGKTYLHIGDEYYPSEYLDSVVSYDYLEFISRDETPTDGIAQEPVQGDEKETEEKKEA